MIKAQRSLIRTLGLTALSLAMLLNTGCKSAQDKANDAAIAQAKQTAIATGVPQQVLWTGKDGKTTVVLVQPPAQGQSAPQLTTNTTTAANTVPGAPGPGQLPMIRPVPPVMTAVAPADPTSAADAPAVPSAAGRVDCRRSREHRTRAAGACAQRPRPRRHHAGHPRRSRHQREAQ